MRLGLEHVDAVPEDLYLRDPSAGAATAPLLEVKIDRAARDYQRVSVAAADLTVSEAVQLFANDREVCESATISKWP